MVIIHKLYKLWLGLDNFEERDIIGMELWCVQVM